MCSWWAYAQRFILGALSLCFKGKFVRSMSQKYFQALNPISDLNVGYILPSLQECSSKLQFHREKEMKLANQFESWKMPLDVLGHEVQKIQQKSNKIWLFVCLGHSSSKTWFINNNQWSISEKEGEFIPTIAVTFLKYCFLAWCLILVSIPSEYCICCVCFCEKYHKTIKH